MGRNSKYIIIDEHKGDGTEKDLMGNVSTQQNRQKIIHIASAERP